MCGAFSIIHPFRDLSGRFNAGYNSSWEKPRYNARPSQQLPIITEANPDEIELATWGIQPSWSKGKALINARAETLEEKPAYRRAFHERRCLVLADGFYEWGVIGGRKIPFHFELKNAEPFAFAGIYENDKDTKRFVIITTEPNAMVQEVHDRMPAMLPKEAERYWLDPDSDPDELQQLLLPYPAHLMRAYPVSTLVNSPKNDSIDVIKPVRL